MPKTVGQLENSLRLNLERMILELDRTPEVLTLTGEGAPSATHAPADDVAG